jgi:hypothetical protein
MMGLASVLLRELPPQLVDGVRSGDYRIYGSIVRSVSKGKIVGHLQETSALSKIAGQGPMAIPSLVGNAITAIQNEQIKDGIKVLKSLHLTNLAFNMVSIGVSVAGTALMMGKMIEIEKDVNLLGDVLRGVKANTDQLLHDRLSEDFVRLKTLFAQLDECWDLRDPSSEWRSIAREAHFLSDNFARRARAVISVQSDSTHALPFLDAFALASATRVTARLACDDVDAAFRAAQMSASELVELGRGYQPSLMVLADADRHAEEIGTPVWTKRIDQAATELASSIGLLRERERAAAASVVTIDYIRRMNFSGREWLQAARMERDSPLIYFPSLDEEPQLSASA